jgi:K+-transporting ATPase ATPase A chain
VNDILIILCILGGTAALSWPLGSYLTVAMERGWTPLRNGFGPQGWKQYLGSMLTFNAVMFALACGILLAQHLLPLNPDQRGPLTWDLVFHTASSFVTNTNLQHYSGEVHMSYLSQIFALMWLQFVSAATGLSCLAALARGLSGTSEGFGNFFLDLQRSTFLVLLPLAFAVAVALALGGVPMTLAGAAQATTIEGAMQTIARGPVAAFIAIKQLGTNGGGFFGPNSTHPFENPTAFTNILSMVCIPILPMACVWMFGRLTGKLRHAAVVFAVMAVLVVAKTVWAVAFESLPASAFDGMPIEAAANMEGKELRFGAALSALWAALTTATSNGSVAAMHNSLNPLTGLAPLVGMWLNETFGGIGVGMINMFLYVVVAVFLAGMMVGRTPEYLCRRVEAREMTLASICLILHPLLILGGTALFCMLPWGVETIKNAGPRGFTEILYEFSSSAANNGSGYEGLGDNTVPWNVATGLVMLLARFVPIVLPIALVGCLAAKRPVAETAGTLRTDTPTFGMMLLGVIVLLGALTFLPAAVLGPVAEHLLAVE